MRSRSIQQYNAKVYVDSSPSSVRVWMRIQVQVLYALSRKTRQMYIRELRCSFNNAQVQHNIEIITVAACILAFLCRCIKLLARNVTSNDTQSQKNMKKKKKKMIKPTLLGNEYDFGNANANANANGVATRINKKTSIRIKRTLLGERSIMPGRDLDENDIHRLWNGKKRKTT